MIVLTRITYFCVLFIMFFFFLHCFKPSITNITIINKLFFLRFFTFLKIVVRLISFLTKMLIARWKLRPVISEAWLKLIEIHRKIILKCIWCCHFALDVGRHERGVIHVRTRWSGWRKSMVKTGRWGYIGPKKCLVNCMVQNVQFTLQKVLTALKMFIRV